MPGENSETLYPSPSSTEGTPPPASSSDFSSKAPPNAGVIAGGVIGGFLFVALIIIVTLLVRRRSLRRKAPSANFLAQNPEWDRQRRRTSTPNSMSHLTITGHRRLESENDDLPPPFVPGPLPYPFPEKLPVQTSQTVTV